MASHIQQIAKKYNNSQDAEKYREAADQWRLPYWDWATDPTVPPATTLQNITVNGPRGVKTLENPLFQYKFQNFPHDPVLFPSHSENFAQLLKYPVTARCINPQGDNDPNRANNEFLYKHPQRDVVVSSRNFCQIK